MAVRYWSVGYWRTGYFGPGYWAGGAAGHRAFVGWVEIEFPDKLNKSAKIGWAAMEVPFGPRRAEFGWAEFAAGSVGSPWASWIRRRRR